MPRPIVWSNFSLQFLDLALQGFVFLEFACEETRRDHRLFSEPLGCQNIGVTALVFISAEVAQFDQPPFHECIQDVMRAAHADPDRFGEFALRHLGIGLKKTQHAKVRILLERIIASGHGKGRERAGYRTEPATREFRGSRLFISKRRVSIVQL